MGDGNFHALAAPVQVSGVTDAVAIAAGFNHSLALRSDGTVWAWGDGIATPVQVSGLSQVRAIASGGDHSLALKSDGTVWAWGDGYNGQLGDGNFHNVATPVQVSALSGIVAISGGGYHSLALKSDGTAWAWGLGEGGQLGDGNFYTTGNRGAAAPVRVRELSQVRAIAGGEYFSLALKSDGTVWAWGTGIVGQLGDGNFYTSPPWGVATPVQASGLSQPVSAIVAGGTHSFAFPGVGGGTPPIITCPADIVVNNVPGQSSAFVNYSVPTVSGGTGNVVVVCNPPSGSVFPVGTTTVTCTATDASGNSASCSFHVTVNESQPCSTSPITVNIYSGFQQSGAGAPYSGLVGTLTPSAITFGTDTTWNWHPFGMYEFGADITGFLDVSADGTYTFALESDDGSRLFIDGSLVIIDDGIHGPLTQTGSATLSAGVHSFEIQFFECCGGESGLDFVLPAGVSYACLNAGQLDVKAAIDGRSDLVIQGNNVHWHHYDFAAPGRHQPLNEPTYLNSFPWFPDWAQPGENRDCDCDSSVFGNLSSPLPADGSPISIDVISARGSVTIVQQPAQSNGYTAILEFNDNAPGGWAWYEVAISYNSQPPTGCAPLPTGVTSWWRADGDTKDSFGNNHGTLQGSATFAAGRVGQAFSFDGNNGYVALPDNIFPYPTSGRGNTPFSFEVWFKTSSGGVIIGQQDVAPYTTPSGWSPAIFVDIDGRLRVEMFYGGDQAFVISTPINDGNFHHVVDVNDGTFETLYLDGVVAGIDRHSQIAYAANYHYQLGTGYTKNWPRGNGGWFNFNGLIDEPTLYNRPLSASEVQSIFAAGSAGKCAPITTLQLTCPADIAVNNDPGQSSAVVNYPAPFVSGGTGNVIVVCNPPSGSTFPLGTTTVTCTATDTAGNNASCSFNVTVNATSGCTLTCPEDITVPNDPGNCGALVNYPPPTTSGGCSGLTITSTLPSGSTFPVGTNLVACTAKDATGNVVAACTFRVVVTDTELPVASYTVVKAPALFANPPRIVGCFQLLATDNCDPDPLIYIKGSVGSFVAGPFHNGDQVEIAHGPRLIPRQVSSTFGGNIATIQLNGDVLLWAVDSSSNASTPIKCK